MNNKSGSESRMTQCTRCGTTELRHSCPKCDDSFHLQKLCEEQKRDIEVYRGALGYSVSGDTPTKTHDGFVPVCGMCDARQKQIEKQRDTLDAIKEAIGGASSHPETGVSIVDDVRDLKAQVEKQRVERESLIKHEKALSDAYLRIRSLVGAWDTNHGGENRFEVTENKVKDLLSQLATQTERVRAMRESLQFIRDMSEKWGYVTIFNTADQSLNQESLGDGK